VPVVPDSAAAIKTSTTADRDDPARGLAFGFAPAEFSIVSILRSGLSIHAGSSQLVKS
jgi:hypothetical protein